jgi:hypothetical protein
VGGKGQDRNAILRARVETLVLLLKPLLILAMRSLGPGRLRLAVLRFGYVLNAF